MENNYWIDFWADYSVSSKGKDEQARVLRTLNKKSISSEKWEFALQHIKDSLEINAEDSVLDLCCGNGLITKYIAPSCASVTAVDILQDLLHDIDTVQYSNVKTICSDIRKLHFKEEQFSKIFLYSSLQYLTHSETVSLFENIYRWLKKDGIAFIGDIPDMGKLWVFFNNKERESIYFQSVKEQKEIIGTWFNKEWLLKLAVFAQFKEGTIIEQDPEMIYSFFRYDMKLVK